MVLCDKGEVTSHFWLPILCANKRVSVMKGNSGEHKMTIRKLSFHDWVLAAGSCFMGDALNKWIGLGKKKWNFNLFQMQKPNSCRRHSSPDPREAGVLLQTGILMSHGGNDFSYQSRKTPTFQSAYSEEMEGRLILNRKTIERGCKHQTWALVLSIKPQQILPGQLCFGAKGEGLSPTEKHFPEIPPKTKLTLQA